MCQLLGDHENIAVRRHSTERVCFLICGVQQDMRGVLRTLCFDHVSNNSNDPLNALNELNTKFFVTLAEVRVVKIAIAVGVGHTPDYAVADNDDTQSVEHDDVHQGGVRDCRLFKPFKVRSNEVQGRENGAIQQNDACYKESIFANTGSYYQN